MTRSPRAPPVAAEMPACTDLALINVEFDPRISPSFVGHRERLALTGVGRLRLAVGPPMRTRRDPGQLVGTTVGGSDATAATSGCVSPSHAPSLPLITWLDRRQSSVSRIGARLPRRASIRRRGNRVERGASRTKARLMGRASQVDSFGSEHRLFRHGPSGTSS